MRVCPDQLAGLYFWFIVSYTVIVYLFPKDTSKLFLNKFLICLQSGQLGFPFHPSILILVNDKFDLASVTPSIHLLHNIIFAADTGGYGEHHQDIHDVHGTVQLHQEERLPPSMHHIAALHHVSSV